MTRKRTRPRDRITQASCLLITALLIVLAVSAGVGTGMASAEPAGMVSVPDQNITENIPADASVPLGASQLHDGRILTDSHAMSLDVILTTPARAGEITGTDTASLTGDMALILRDTEHSGGRRVAIDAGLLQTALGYEPQAIYGTHENGEQWTAPAEYVDGYLVFDVPHFSTNTVTFSGKVDINAQDVSSGTQFNYTLNNNANPTNPTLTITGISKTENRSYSLPSSGMRYILVSGSEVNNAEITASAGSESNTKAGPDTYYQPSAGDVDGDGTAEILYRDGSNNLDYYDTENGSNIDTGFGTYSPPSAGDVDGDGTAEIVYRDTGDNLDYYDTESGSNTVTGGVTSDTPSAGDADGDGTAEILYRDTNGHLMYYDAESDSNTDTGADISDSPSTGDVDGDGTAEIVYKNEHGNLGFYDHDDATNTGIEIYKSPSAGDVDGDGTAEIVYLTTSYEIRYYDTESGSTTQTSVSAYGTQSTGDVDGDGIAEIVYRGRDKGNLGYYDAESNSNTDTGFGTYSPPSAGDIDGDGSDEILYPTPGYVLAYYGLAAPVEVQIDLGNDGSVDKTLSVPKKSTNSTSLPSLTTSTSKIGISSNGPLESASLSYTEITRASNPEITISSESGTQTVTHSGSLTDGEEIDLSGDVDMSKISGETTVTVNLDTGKLNLAYSHTAQKQVSTIYEASTFEESYNTHYTYADATDSAQITIPFSSERVVGIKRFDYRINDGQWKSVAPADRRFSNATATAYLSRANGGPLPAGATVEVRATGRKVNVENGEVAITDPTKPGEPLDTQLKIESRSQGFSLNVGPTDDGDRIHYAYSSNYPTEDYVVIDGAGNQRLYLPESQPGDTFRMKHVRTKANVVSGDAKIRVVDPDDKKFEIMPGPGGDGDTVELTYYGAKSGNTYLLESLTREIVLDTETANSPVTFVDDDSHEMWRILLESGGSGDTGGGGGLIGVASNAGSAVSGLLPAISVPALGGIGGVGSAGFALALAGAVAVLVYGNVFGRIAGVIASLNPFGGTPASGGGADTGNGGIDTSGVTSALSGVVTRAGRVGGTAGVRVLRATTQLLTTSTRIIGRESARLARYLAANPSVALGLGGVGVAVAAYQGLVQLTPQATTAILIGSGGLVTYLVLQRTGTFSWLSFGLIFGAFVILGAGAINPDVLASFGASLQDILPLLVIVGAYVVYRILQTRSQDASTPDTIVRFTGGSGSGSDDNNN